MILALLLGGCATLEPLPDTQPCLEAGYAIARRTFECTGDGDLANARYEAFEQQYECIPIGDFFVDTGIVTKYLQATDTADPGVFPPDYFHCALAIDGLACEKVAEFGDDLDQWLAVSNACAYVVQPAGGSR